MERLSLAAVGSAAGYQLLTLVSAGFGDALPSWTHFVVEIATAAVFLLQVFAFMKWDKLSSYYAAVEHSYNKQLASGQTGMIQATLAQVDTVRVVEADENSAALPASSEVDAEASTTGDSVAQNTLQKVVKMLPQSTKRVRLEDRELALESLFAAHPELSVKELSQQVGLSESTVRQWKRGK
jgi:hypothetical protein